MRVALGLVAGLLLAGCVAPGAPGPLAAPASGAPAPAAAPAAMTLEDCRNTGGLFRVPAGAAEPYLPDGFEALPASLVPGRVQLFVEGLACAHARIAGQDLGPMQAVYAELEVLPPPAYEAEGGDYTIPVLYLASPPEVADAYAQWRFAGAAPAEIARTETSTPLAQLVTVEAGDVTLVIAMAEPLSSALQGSSVRQFGVVDREVRSVVDSAFGTGSCTQGAAVLRVTGSVPLLQDALPAATGGRCAGFTSEIVLAQGPS